MKPQLIVVEGGEGAGKSTQIMRLKEQLEREGFSVVHTREPGGTPLAEEIRTLLFTKRDENVPLLAEQYLFWAARCLHIQNGILEYLARGDVVLCDRFDASTFAYQMRDGLEGESDREVFFTFRNLTLGNLKPHYVFFDIEPEEGLRRIALDENREVNHFDERDLKFHHDVRRRYKEFLNLVPSAIVIDASKSKDEVFRNFAAAVQAILQT